MTVKDMKRDIGVLSRFNLILKLKYEQSREDISVIRRVVKKMVDQNRGLLVKVKDLESENEKISKQVSGLKELVRGIRGDNYENFEKFEK